MIATESSGMSEEMASEMVDTASEADMAPSASMMQGRLSLGCAKIDVCIASAGAAIKSSNMPHFAWQISNSRAQSAKAMPNRDLDESCTSNLNVGSNLNARCC